MKPLNLTMSAFGSYADVQMIDFSELGTTGLYLITGETGSGKTTIFDAISFALFGKASGSGRDDYTVLRSDFSDEKAKTYVELNFVSGDNRYNIRRTIKKTGQDVVLVLPDGTSMSGDRNVKQKVAEIVGLERDQFAQIVMIAQNDFLRFLQSGTNDRLEILRHIFGTGALKQFQERLKTLVKRENDKLALIFHDFERYEVDIYKRDEQFANWKVQVKIDKAALSETDTQLAKYDKTKQTLAADLAFAEELSKKFESLAKCLLAIKEHNSKEKEQEEIKVRVARGEISLRKIKPLADEAHKVWANYSVAKTELESAKKQESDTSAELIEATRVLEELPLLTKVQEDYSVLVKEWETSNEKLKRLIVLQTNRSEIIVKQYEHTKTKGKLTTVLDSLSKLLPIVDCQVELDNITTELKSNNDKLTKLLALKSDFSVINDKQKELKKEQTEFEALNANFASSYEKYQMLEERFLKSQAGIIASGLIAGSPCPVCGSAEHPAPAKLSNSDVTEANLKKAKEVKDNAQSNRETKSLKCSRLNSEIKTLVNRFLSDITPIIANVTIENSTILLPELIGTTQVAVTEFSEKKSSAEKSLFDLKKESESLINKREELTRSIGSTKSEVDTLIKRFISDLSEFIPAAKWETSETEFTDLFAQTQNMVKDLALCKDRDKKTLDELSENCDLAIKRKATGESCVKSAQTLVAERSANEQKLLKHSTEAQSSYKVALQINGFSDEAEYEAALATETDLAKLNKQISDYEKNGEQIVRDIARLQSETSGKERPDIEKMRTEIEVVHSETKALGEKRDEINSRLSKTETALKELHLIGSNFEKVEKRYAAVKQLADTANGKIDFETYAQMAYFERVLRAANIRLRLMSQNRYTLLRKTDSNDGRKRSGLELEVLDAYTGKARSANSLSGGESFMASLSLALGLSDIVQQNAGGIRLDAMFIDEGFGSLDADVLELAIRTLSEMAGTNRIIGIISHVSELRQRIDKQIQVLKTTTGSKINLVV